MPRMKKRGVESYTRLMRGQREHLESVARYRSAKENKTLDWQDVLMDAVELVWPIGIEPKKADKAR